MGRGKAQEVEEGSSRERGEVRQETVGRLEMGDSRETREVGDDDDDAEDDMAAIEGRLP